MRILSLFLVFLLPVSALAADVSATYVYSDGTEMTMSARDEAHVRMDNGPDAYTLMRGDKVYMVSSNGEGGWNIMDMDQMSGLMGVVGEDMSGYAATYVDLGRSERIAGYTGKVYEVTVTDKGKLVSRDEMVLARHGDLDLVNRYWLAMAKRMTQGMGMNMAHFVEEAEKLGYGGMLRYGTDMKLKGISKGALPADHFELPASGRQVDMMGNPQTTESTPEESEESDDVKTLKQLGSVLDSIF